MDAPEPTIQPPPWGRDRDDLDEAAVRGIVQSRFPELSSKRVQKAGEGWDFDVWRVDDTAFRFAKTARAAEQQLLESRWLERIRPRLPIAIPQQRWVGEAGDDFPFSFVGYPYLAGFGGQFLMPATPRWKVFARRYGQFLRALHTTPLTGDERAQAHTGTSIDDHLHDFEAEIRTALAPAAFERAWSDALDPSVERGWTGDPMLCHNDLCPEHWIFDADGELVAVIDWTDVGVCDPIGDFVGLWIWFGEDVLLQALAAYGPVSVPHLVPRIRARAIGKVLHWIGEWVRWPDPPRDVNERAETLIPRFTDLLRR